MKIFGIGANRTGTGSLAEALRKLGYNISHWDHHEQICQNLVKNKLKHEFLNTYDGAADLPIPSIYRELDRAYPGSKFILTIRDEKDWIRSQELHHKRIGVDKPYFECFLLYGSFFFDRKKYLEAYRRHNIEVVNYFYGRKDLLVVNITIEDAWDKICSFLGKSKPELPFPQINRRPEKSPKKII